MRALTTYKLVNETPQAWLRINQEEYTSQLTKPDQKHLAFIKRQYYTYSTEDLIRETYLRYPYYATRSEIGPRLLTPEQWDSIVQVRPSKQASALYTIGYEGVSIETYFNKLLLNDVRVLCDVRRNSISQKAGFSKNDLRYVSQALDIEYVHMPELGIPSNQRQELNTQRDYDKLFARYSADYLPSQASAVQSIDELVKTKKRVALTCFEASFCQCHRSQVANAVINLPQCEFNLIHL
jgi:hypothetical protein